MRVTVGVLEAHEDGFVLAKELVNGLGHFPALVGLLLFLQPCLVSVLQLADLVGDALDFFLALVLDGLKKLGVES